MFLSLECYINTSLLGADVSLYPLFMNIRLRSFLPSETICHGLEQNQGSAACVTALLVSYQGHPPSQKTMLSTTVLHCPQPHLYVNCVQIEPKQYAWRKKKLKKNSVSWDVAACSPVVHQCFRVINILSPATCLTYPEEVCRVFLQKVTELSPDCMASQSRKQCFSLPLLWELKIRQNFKELKFENYPSFI